MIGRRGHPAKPGPAATAGHARAALALLFAAGLGMTPGPARAEWQQPDPSLRDAQLDLRQALRDTVGASGDPVRLDTLAVSLFRLGRFEDAEKLFHRVLDLRPGDVGARAALGKLALFRDRAAEAESLLSSVADVDALARADLYALRLRRGEYGPAAEMAADVGEAGREPLLRELAEGGAYLVSQERDEVRLQLVRLWPAPIVRVRLNGESVLMVLDSGLADVLLDDGAARRCKVHSLASEAPAFWSGTRIAVRNALIQKLELGGARIERVPAGVFELGRYSLEINPQSEHVAGVIGANLLRRFTPTLDYGTQTLILRRNGVSYAPAGIALGVPFELWGECELTVYGSLADGRRMAMMVAIGLPGCGAAAPKQVFDELGVKPGMTAGLAKSGSWLRASPWIGVTVPSVSVGQMVRERVPGWSDAMEYRELWRHGVRRDAILGGDFFRGRRLTIDWQELRLVIEQER